MWYSESVTTQPKRGNTVMKIYAYKNPDSTKEKITAAQARQAMEYRYGRYLTDDLAEATLIPVFGGDGTMLGALKTLAEFQKAHPDFDPQRQNVIGLNYGDIGYYMNRPVQDLVRLEQKATRVTVHPLDVRFKTTDGQEHNRFAFNEAIIRRDSPTEQSCHIEVLSDGQRPVRSIVKGDGLVISTPMGSTAYYRDAYGEPFPIDSGLIGLQPICDRDTALRIGGTYPDSQEIRLNVLNGNGKRPAYGNTDNDERIADVVRCEVKKSTKIAVNLLMNPTCPAWRNRRSYQRV